MFGVPDGQDNWTIRLSGMARSAQVERGRMGGGRAGSLLSPLLFRATRLRVRSLSLGLFITPNTVRMTRSNLAARPEAKLPQSQIARILPCYALELVHVSADLSQFCDNTPQFDEPFPTS